MLKKVAKTNTTTGVNNMARKYLEDMLKEVTVRDIEKVHLPSAYALLQEEGRKAGVSPKSEVKMLSSSVKFDKPYPGLDVSQKGMYLMPAGKGGCADACKDKTAGCSAACLHNSGFQSLAHQTARTNLFRRDPAAGLAVAAFELHTHAENVLKQGGLPSGRLDATSELHIEDIPEVGDYVWGGPGGKYQKIQKTGPAKGLPHLIGSEYGKRYAKEPLGGPTPKPGQPNVYRAPSWSERLTRGRALELIGEGHDIALPVTNIKKKDRPTHISMQFGTGEEPLSLPVSDFDEHDITFLRNRFKPSGEPGGAGILREKRPGFDKKRPSGSEQAAARFLRPHPVETPVGMPTRAKARKQL